MVGLRKRTALASPISAQVEPDLTESHKQAVLTSLRWAWDELSRTQLGLVETADEETITEGLERLLNRRVRGKRSAHWLESFDTVTRSSKVRTSDGRIEKQPDLHFRPIPYRRVQCASDWAWFVECKIVDGAKFLRLYRIEGIERFFSSEYAAHMPSAAMLGYCRDGTTPFDVLSTELRNAHGTTAVIAGSSTDICSSSHLRAAPLSTTIDLTHLWLVCGASRTRVQLTLFGFGS